MDSKTSRRGHSKALMQAAERAGIPKSENATDSHHGISLILKGNDASARARRYSIDLIDILYDIARNGDERARDRLLACQLLLDRGHGRPATVIQETIENVDEIQPNLASIDRQGEAVEWMNSGKPQHEWPLAVLQHLGLADE